MDFKSEPRRLRVDGYVRVSRVGYRSGERFISPTVQREQIFIWAETRGAEVLQVWEELDESGGRCDRPLLETAIRRIEDGVSHGLVVAKVDRFGRSLLQGLLTIQRIEAAGGSFYSVADGLDLDTDTGRLVLHIMLSMAEWQLNRYREAWDVAARKRIARGAFCGAYVPAGYRKTAAGRLELDPRTAPHMLEAFRMRAEGLPLRPIGRYLQENAVKTGRGNPFWTSTAISTALKNPTYLGAVRNGRLNNPDAHPPLVDKGTWSAAQVPRTIAPFGAGRRSVELAGLIRCAGCGFAMVRGRGRHGPEEFAYGCKVNHPAGRCQAPAYISARHIHPCVEDIAFYLLSRRRSSPTQQLAQAEQKAAQAQTDLARYRDSDHVLRAVGETAFAAGLATRVERLRRSHEAVALARSRMGAHRLPPVQELEQQWPRMGADERRNVLTQVLDAVIVKRGRGHVDARVVACPRGTAPTTLPRTGHPKNPPRKVTHDDRWVKGTDVAERAPWPVARIERELRSVLATRTEWPTHNEFLAMGHGRLHRHIAAQGGEEYWAHRLGKPLTNTPIVTMTDASLRQALELHLQGKTSFPSRAQLEADGLPRLARTMRSRGGIERWADELGLPVAPGGAG